MPIQVDDDNLVSLLRDYIQSHKNELVDDWIQLRERFKSGVYRNLPEMDVVHASEHFLDMINDVLLEPDGTKAYRIIERSLKEIIRKRVIQGVDLENLLEGSLVHRESIIESLRRNDVYLELPEKERLQTILLLHSNFEKITRAIAKMAHEAAVSEIDRLRSFNENILLSVSEGIVIEDHNGIIIYANPKYLKMMQYTKEDLLGSHWLDTVPKDQLKMFRDEVSKRNLGIDGKYEGILRTKEGVRIPVLISARALHEEGKFKGVLSVITDISNIKHMQNQLTESKRELERLNVELETYSKQLEEDNIRLRNLLNIEPVKEEEAEGKVTYTLEPGYLFLILTHESNVAFRVFEDLVRHGHPGLCVSRMLPESIRKTYSLERTPIIWLTSNKVPDTHCIAPSNIVDLSSAIIKFIERSENGIIILEGIEYLISQNNFRSILNLIQLLNDKIMLVNSSIIIPLDPEVIDPKDLHMIRKEVREFDAGKVLSEIPFMPLRDLDR